MSLPVAEQWRAIPDWEGYYEVSDLGRVRSLSRTVVYGGSRAGARHHRGRVLRPGTNCRTGRITVSLYRGDFSATYTTYTLMLTAFVGPRPPGMEACHNDGDYTNNALSNLRWDTSSSNSYDTVMHGMHNNAIKTHCPRAHRLAEPNLVPSTLAQGRRDCRSCATARAMVRKLTARGVEADLRVLSDDAYRRFMKE